VTLDSITRFYVILKGPKSIATLCPFGPKREIFVAGIFAQIRPIWIGDLGTRPKNPKKIMFGALNSTFNRRNICLTISATALKKLFLFSYVEKKVVLNCFYMHLNRPRKTFLNFEFLLCLKMVFVRF
jgi:hypothetical protein